MSGWQEVMKQKHEAQIKAHEASWGSPLGVLRTPPTEQQYRQGRQALAAERRAAASSPAGRTTKSRKGNGR